MPELGLSWRRAQPRWLDFVAGISREGSIGQQSGSGLSADFAMGHFAGLRDLLVRNFELVPGK